MNKRFRKLLVKQELQKEDEIDLEYISSINIAM